MSKIYTFDYTAEGEEGQTIHGQMDMLSNLNVDAYQAIRQELGNNVAITSCQLRKDEDDDSEVVEHIKSILREDNPEKPDLIPLLNEPKNFIRRCKDYLTKPQETPYTSLDMEPIEDSLPAPADMGEMEEVKHG